MHRHRTRRERRRLVACGLVLLIVVVTGLRCGPREAEEAPSTQSAEKTAQIVEVLQLMPNSAVTGLAVPSLQDFDDRLEAFLLRASPESIDMEAEIRFVVQQFGRTLNVPDARHLEDIALAKGLDPDRPIAVFFSLPPPPEAESPETNQTDELPQGRGNDRMDRLPLSEHARRTNTTIPGVTDRIHRDVPLAELVGGAQSFAVVAFNKDRAESERTMLDLAGNVPMSRESIAGTDVVLQSDDEGRFAYFFHGNQVIFGSHVGLVRDIAARMTAPATIRYGSDGCPAHADDTVVQLTRIDLLSQFGEDAEKNLPLPARQSLADTVQEMRTAYSGPDPVVTLWRITEGKLDVVSRFDRKTHPKAVELRGRPHVLPHLAVIPKDAVGLISFDFGGRLRELAIEGARSSLSGAVDPDSPMGTLPARIGDILAMLGDTVTLAVAGGESGNPAVTLLAQFQNGEEARTRLRDMGMMPIVSETYNGTDLYLVPVPVPVGDGIHYALPGDTLVLGTDLGELKTIIDLLDSGRSSSWAAAQYPPLDAREALLYVVDIQPTSLASLLTPTLESEGGVSPDTVSAGALVWEKIRDLRIVSRVVNEWQEMQLTVALQ